MGGTDLSYGTVAAAMQGSGEALQVLGWKYGGKESRKTLSVVNQGSLTGDAYLSDLAARIWEGELNVDYEEMDGAYGYYEEGGDTLTISDALLGGGQEGTAKLAAVIAHEGTHAYGNRVEGIAHLQAGNTYGALNAIFGLEADSEFEGEILAGILNPESWQENTGDTDYFIETAWDVFSIGVGIASFANNVNEGHIGFAIVDGLGILVDIGMAAIPGAPAFGSAAIKAMRGIEAAGDVTGVAKVADKVDNAIDATKAENLAKYVDGKSPTSGFKPGKPFRDGVTELMGNPRPGDQAHHVLPQKWSEKFNALDIDIHDPQFGVWWNETPHGKQSTAYNKEWEAFFVDPSRTKDDVFKFADDLSEKFGYEWSPPRVD